MGFKIRGQGRWESTASKFKDFSPLQFSNIHLYSPFLVENIFKNKEHK